MMKKILILVLLFTANVVGAQPVTIIDVDIDVDQQKCFAIAVETFNKYKDLQFIPSKIKPFENVVYFMTDDGGVVIASCRGDKGIVFLASTYKSDVIINDLVSNYRNKGITSESTETQ